MNFRQLISSFGFHFSLIFCCGFILFFPVPYYVFPDVGAIVEPFIRPFIQWIGTHLLTIQEPFTSELMSDSTGLYIFVFVLSLFSLLLAIPLSFIIKPQHKSKIALWFYTLMAYYLALTLLKYGADKIFKHQFYLPEPNTLFTPIGQTTPDLLFWTSMGSSYSYTVFSGIIEIIPALLLLFRKTRLIGIILAICVLTNVVMINFGFDITVKVYSLFLLFISLILITPHYKTLYHFFILREKTAQSDIGFIIDSKRSLLGYTITKTLVLGFIIFESFGIYFAANNLNDDLAPRPELYGAYNVFLFTDDEQILPASMTHPDRFKRIFFHRRSYFIIQTMDDRFIDYKLLHNKEDQTLVLSSPGLPESDQNKFTLSYLVQNDELVIFGYLHHSYISFYSKKINLNELPLLKEEFHWTIDDF